MAQPTFAMLILKCFCPNVTSAVMLAVALVSLSSLLLGTGAYAPIQRGALLSFCFFCHLRGASGSGIRRSVCPHTSGMACAFRYAHFGRMAVPAEFNLYSVFGGSGAAYPGLAGGHRPQLWQAHDYLSGGRSAVFSDRTVIFRALCPVVPPHLATLRRRSCRRRNSLPCSCAIAELYRRAQCVAAGFSLHGRGRCACGQTRSNFVAPLTLWPRSSFCSWPPTIPARSLT